MQDPYRLKRHEGFRSKPYTDTVDKLTIGYGRNLDDMGISEAEADAMLSADIRRAQADVRAVLSPDGPMDPRDPRAGGLGAFRWAALVNMAFNLGRTRLSGFKNIIAAVEAGDWDRAADEALDSRWARQVGHRSTEVAHAIRHNEWPPEPEVAEDW